MGNGLDCDTVSDDSTTESGRPPRPAAATEFSPQRLLALVFEEALLDGTISAGERKLIDVIQRGFRLPDELKHKLQSSVEDRFAAGKLGSSRPLSRTRLHEKCLCLVLVDGIISPGERRIIEAIGKLLKITPEEHTACMQRVRQWLRGRQASSAAKVAPRPEAPEVTQPAAEDPAAVVAPAEPEEPEASPTVDSPPVGEVATEDVEAPGAPAGEAQLIEEVQAVAEEAPLTTETPREEIAESVDTVPVSEPTLEELDQRTADIVSNLAGSSSVPSAAGFQIQQTVESLAPFLEAEGEDRTRAFTLFTDLVPILARAEKLDVIEARLSALLAQDPSWDRLEDACQTCLYEAFVALAKTQGKKDPVDVLRLAIGLAEHARDPALAWRIAASSACTTARALAERNKWELHGKVMALFATVPADWRQESIGPHSEALADQVCLGAEAGKLKEAWAALDRLKSLLEQTPSPAGSIQMALALEALMALNDPEPQMDWVKISSIVHDMFGLVTRNKKLRDVALPVARASEVALTCFVEAEEDERLLDLLPRLRVLARQFPGDAEIATALARGLVNSSGTRAAKRKKGSSVLSMMDSLGGKFGHLESGLAALKETLECVGQAAPKCDAVWDAAGRFGEVTSVELDMPPRPKRDPSRRHSDVEALARNFETLQKSPQDRRAAQALDDILGTGGYVRRIVDEGDGAYWVDEKYFTDLLDEVGRQVESDSSQFWTERRIMIETLTRYMLEDGSPKVKKGASMLRKRLGFPV